MEELIEVKDLEVGKKYYVLNGEWSFKVLSKTETHVKIKHLHGRGEIPLSATSEEYAIVKR